MCRVRAWTRPRLRRRWRRSWRLWKVRGVLGGGTAGCWVAGNWKELQSSLYLVHQHSRPTHPHSHKHTSETTTHTRSVDCVRFPVAGSAPAHSHQRHAAAPSAAGVVAASADEHIMANESMADESMADAAPTDCALDADSALAASEAEAAAAAATEREEAEAGARLVEQYAADEDEGGYDMMGDADGGWDAGGDDGDSDEEEGRGEGGEASGVTGAGSAFSTLLGAEVRSAGVERRVCTGCVSPVDSSTRLCVLCSPNTRQPHHPTLPHPPACISIKHRAWLICLPPMACHHCSALAPARASPAAPGGRAAATGSSRKQADGPTRLQRAAARTSPPSAPPKSGLRAQPLLPGLLFA